MEFEEEINSQGIISESDLLDVYENQYNDIFSKIIKISEEKFFELLQEQVLLNLRLINKLSDLSLMSFFQELLSERYKTDKEKALNDLDKIIKLKEEEIIYLNYNNCYIHCKNNLEIKHKCGNKMVLYGEYIYCINCKNVYNENQIKLYCDKCNKIFFSKLRKNNIINEDNNDEYAEEILYPVAFSEKHNCGNNNKDEQIKCLECGNELYLNLLEEDDNFLICDKCNLLFDIKNTQFKCNSCGNSFLCNYKLFNAFSYNNIKLIFLIHTLRKNKKAFTENINNKKCKCDLKEIKEFKHEDDKGILLEGNFLGNKKIICEQCFQIWDRNNFIWKCPLCKEEFIEEINNNNNQLENEIGNEDNKEKEILEEEKREENNNIKKEEEDNEKEKENQEENEIRDNEGEYNMDIYNENFEDYEEFNEEIKDQKKEEIKDKIIEEEKKEEKEIIEKIKDKKEIINNNKINKEKEDLKDIKSKQSTNKAYNVIENNKTIIIDLPQQINTKNEKKNIITEDNKIKDKKFYINNQYHCSNNTNAKEKNKNISSKIIINRRNKNNIIESKYSSNNPKKIPNNNSNHQIIQIKEKNKNNINNNRKEKDEKEFKNIQKYFDDFNEEYVKEMENKEHQKKKLKSNKSKIDINKNQIKNSNNVLYNIKYISKNSNKIINKNKPVKNTKENNNKINIQSNPKENEIKPENISQKNTYKTITHLNSNNYKNIKVLGQGSYGKIYLVEDINTKEQYAMKKLILGDEFELKDNQDEYNMIMQISSSYPEINIIHVYATETKNFDQYNFVFYVLMEVANCDWEKELLNRSKYKAYYTEEEIIYLLQSLVDTLSYLQQIGICHRDIKPQNILCFGDKYKISDFGEAKFRKKWRYVQNPEGYTSMQTVRGTELYMSPILYRALKTEPSKGVNHNVFKSDVFSLGMCFLLASCLDYKCLYDMRKVRNMNDVRNVINKSINGKYSNNFSDVLFIMLNLNEKDRPDFIELSNMI